MSSWVFPHNSIIGKTQEDEYFIINLLVNKDCQGKCIADNFVSPTYKKICDDLNYKRLSDTEIDNATSKCYDYDWLIDQFAEDISDCGYIANELAEELEEAGCYTLNIHHLSYKSIRNYDGEYEIEINYDYDVVAKKEKPDITDFDSITDLREYMTDKFSSEIIEFLCLDKGIDKGIILLQDNAEQLKSTDVLEQRNTSFDTLPKWMEIPKTDKDEMDFNDYMSEIER